jgi:arsenate reductase
MRRLRSLLHKPAPELRLALAEGITSALLMGSAIALLVLGERWLYPLPAIEVSIALAWALIVFASLASGLAPNAGNPAVSLARAALLGRPGAETGLITAAQIAGAIAGTILAQWLLNLDAVQRAPGGLGGVAPYLYGGLAAFLFALAILAFPARNKLLRAGAASLTAFVLCWAGPDFPLFNPAGAIARTLTSSPLGFYLWNAGLLITAELAGGLAAAFLSLFFPRRRRIARPPKRDLSPAGRIQAAGFIPKGNSSTAMTKPLESSTASSHKER